MIQEAGGGGKSGDKDDAGSESEEARCAPGKPLLAAAGLRHTTPLSCASRALLRVLPCALRCAAMAPTGGRVYELRGGRGERRGGFVKPNPLPTRSRDSEPAGNRIPGDFSRGISPCRPAGSQERQTGLCTSSERVSASPSGARDRSFFCKTRRFRATRVYYQDLLFGAGAPSPALIARAGRRASSNGRLRSSAKSCEGALFRSSSPI